MPIQTFRNKLFDKSKFLSILLFLIFATSLAYGQNNNKAFYYTNRSKQVSTLDSADLIRVVDLTPDSDKLYGVKEYYKDGKIKCIGRSNFRTDLAQYGDVSMQGQYISYYPSGKRESMGMNDGNVRVGEWTFYYPNGNIYCIKKLQKYGPIYNISKIQDNTLLIKCFDTLGKVTAENGNGHWLTYYDNFRKIKAEGSILKGSPIGVWYGHVIDSVAIYSVSRFEVEYQKGIQNTLKSYDKAGGVHKFDSEFEYAKYTGDLPYLIDHIKKGIRYDPETMGNDLTISLIVENDGTLTNISFVGNKEPAMNELLNAAMKKYSTNWIPGKYLGFKMRYGVNFSLGYEKRGMMTNVMLIEDLLPETTPDNEKDKFLNTYSLAHFTNN